ncbi:MAG: NAD(P)/FAD-dependent oxidoreductase [Gemmatimonadaceae bacterium]
MTYDAIVIGAGPNGLTAAATLAKSGRTVLVLESAHEIGGHTRTIEFTPGFRSPLNEDCGWLPPAVAKSLGITHHELHRVTRPVTMSVVRNDGALWSLRPVSAQGTAESVRELSDRDASRWPAFVKRMHQFAGILETLYQLPAPDIATSSLREILPLLGVGRKLRALGRSDMIEFLRIMPMSIQDLVDDTFESELLKAAIASKAVRDLQQGPRSGGTTFNLLHYMTSESVRYFGARLWTRGGPDAFARAAADVARARGVEIRTDARVERIIVAEYGVRGVVLAGGEEIAARTVISTADPKRTLLGLVDPVWLDPDFMLAVRNIRMRGCTAYVLYALDALEDRDRLFVSSVSLTSDTASLEKAADAAKYGEISPSPHVEFFAPTQRWPQLAPEGKHVVAARVQYAPYHLRSGDWTAADAAGIESQVRSAIGRVIPGFDSTVLHHLVLTPRDIEDRFGATEGALTQGERALDQILFMRPVPGWGRYATPIDGLYLGGAGAHPGHGVLGGAGWLAARSV